MTKVNFDMLMAPMYWTVVFGVLPGFMILLFKPTTENKWCYWAMKALVMQGVVVAIVWNLVWMYLLLLCLQG